jgi:hypothetical protein
MSTHEAVTSAGASEMSREDSRTQLRLIATLCGAGSCPTVYRTDRGTYVVQGRTVPAGGTGVDVPEGESLVEIPFELLERLHDER